MRRQKKNVCQTGRRRHIFENFPRKIQIIDTFLTQISKFRKLSKESFGEKMVKK